MTAEVVPLPAPTREPVRIITDEVPAFFASLVAQTDAANHELEHALHEKNRGFTQQLTAIDQQIVALSGEAKARYAEWQSHGGFETHIPFVGKALFVAVMLGSIGGEWLLAATALAGLQLQDWETYVTAFGVVGTGVLLTKAVGVNLRWLACQALKQSPQRWFEVALLVCAVGALLAMLVGMSQARVGYAQSDLQTGGAGLSQVTTQGLALLQGALYLAQVAIFWYVTPSNVVADRARRNYLKAAAQIVPLVKLRAGVAAQLNKNVNQLHAQWATNIHEARQMMGQYLRELHIRGRHFGPGVCQELREDWFAPVPQRVAGAAEPAKALPGQ